MTAGEAMIEKVEKSIELVSRWVEVHKYRAYDPGDGNNSFLHVFTFNNLMLERVLQQTVMRTPFNLRPWIGIRPHVSTKGMGYMAAGYISLFNRTQLSRDRDRAEFCLDWLIQHRAPDYPQYCWGNDFSFSTRAGKIPRYQPTIVWSSLIGHAFLDAYEALREAKYLEVASSVADWIINLPRENTDTGHCLSYVAFKQSSIHNSNMLGASLLARVASHTRQSALVEVAKHAMAYSCTRQNADGAWFYGEEPRYHWIDNFHTGYNLDSLKQYTDLSGDRQFEENLHRGLRYFKRTFFETDGRPKYYHDRTYPTDIQCAAQAIETLAMFADQDGDELDLAQKVAAWTIDNMQARDGHFYYRDLGWRKSKVPMFHWGQATMFKALAHLLAKLTASNPQQRNSQIDESEPPKGSLEHSLRYALVTPARNEEALIEQTIRSVVAQTVRPVRWIIVSDGSTDRTDQIVRRYADQYEWIELLRMPEHRDRQFAAKAHSFNAGHARLNGTPYDIVGNLDADITFEPDYFEFLMGKFAADPRLGVAGTPFVENRGSRDNHTYAHRFAQLEHVSGACQLFRKECFEEVGGYVPIKGGAIDWIAVTTARMKGWKTRTFVEKTCLHHRVLGTGNDRPLMVRFRYGQKAYYVGGHPLWEVSRGFFEMRKQPFLVGGAIFLAGYVWAFLRRMERPISSDLIEFHRREQMARLSRLFRGTRGEAELSVENRRA
jgi:glycosyltransferase involved in cell wall biosynthesis